MCVCVCVRERERERERGLSMCVRERVREVYECVYERERETESKSVIILYASSEEIHNAGKSQASPATLGQTMNLVELE